MHPAIIAAATPVPAYCHNPLKAPLHWAECFKAGWSQPTTGAANAGGFAGHSFGPVLIGLLIGLAIIIALSRSRTPATR